MGSYLLKIFNQNVEYSKINDLHTFVCSNTGKTLCEDQNLIIARLNAEDEFFRNYVNGEYDEKTH